jgi:hypothetical protein
VFVGGFEGTLHSFYTVLAFGYLTFTACWSVPPEGVRKAHSFDVLFLNADEREARERRIQPKRDSSRSHGNIDIAHAAR